VAQTFGAEPVLADGALAVGTTGNVAADGMAVGGAFNNRTVSQAIATALSTCRSQPNIPQAAAHCKIVGTFASKCYAAAFDSKSGTTGAGWAIAANLAATKKQALANCQATAGKDRAKFCQIDSSITACDRHN
jgi:hypothetical protein